MAAIVAATISTPEMVLRGEDDEAIGIEIEIASLKTGV